MTIPVGLKSMLHDAYENAEQRGFPAFCTGIETSTPFNSLPYVTTFQHFRARYADERRNQLLSRLDVLLERARTLGVVIEYMLCGGSFIRLDQTPKDLDCVLFYRLAPDVLAAVPDLRDLQVRGVKAGIDCRLVPLDGTPLIVLKSAVYFGVLYALETRGQGQPPVIGSGPVLIHLELE